MNPSSLRESIRAGRCLRRLAAAGAAATLVGVLPACVQVHHHHEPPAKVAKVRAPGPPPHAPAHGHRHRHRDGVELVFDVSIGVYAVVGHPGYYHDGDRFFRRLADHWEACSHFRGEWARISVERVPAALHAKHAKKRKHHRTFPARIGD